MQLIAARSVNFSSPVPTYTTMQGTVHPLLLPHIVYQDDDFTVIAALAPR